MKSRVNPQIKQGGTHFCQKKSNRVKSQLVTHISKNLIKILVSVQNTTLHT